MLQNLVADVLVGTMLFRLGLLRMEADASFPREVADFVVRALTPCFIPAIRPNDYGGDREMSHVVRKEADSSASIETVWHLLSTVDTWPTWSRHKLARLERDGNPTPDGLGAIRVLAVNPGKPAKCNREEVVAFEAPVHFGYTLLSGQPLDDYRSDVRLSALPGGGTRITWESRFATHGPTGWFWVLAIRWVLKHWSADLAKGAERAASASTVSRPASRTSL